MNSKILLLALIVGLHSVHAQLWYDPYAMMGYGSSGRSGRYRNRLMSERYNRFGMGMPNAYMSNFGYGGAAPPYFGGFPGGMPYSPHMPYAPF
ncbi:unnamed protein product [Anisakis simplex]|uniref:Uncharacterized protein n=1 Tax=Anisakis simplex TaxID=6269 RepID=A0A0M3K6H1_ANISI|nr:unnamed protein product [Anisakis simplex]